MSTSTTTDGIILASYTPNLSDSDLDFLHELATSKLAVKSRKYGDWLLALVTGEQARRIAEDGPDPIEADLPRFNASRWTGADLADALQASAVATRIATERPGVAELLDKLDFVLRNWTAARLRRLG